MSYLKASLLSLSLSHLYNFLRIVVFHIVAAPYYQAVSHFTMQRKDLTLFASTTITWAKETQTREKFVRKFYFLDAYNLKIISWLSSLGKKNWIQNYQETIVKIAFIIVSFTIIIRTEILSFHDWPNVRLFYFPIKTEYLTNCKNIIFEIFYLFGNRLLVNTILVTRNIKYIQGKW